MTADDVKAELAGLVLERFDEIVALRLGEILLDIARDEELPVVIDIRNASRTFFHAALPGVAGFHDNWARRKSNLALLTGEASLAVGLRNRTSGTTLAVSGLDMADYADHGGAVPLVVENAGMVAVATASGLEQTEDHRLVLRGLRALLSAK